MSHGRHVLLSPGLGTMPEAWPYLSRPATRQRLSVHSWYHRGTLGSARPADPSRIRLADHVADAVAVLDDAGVERAVVMGWSVGAAVAIELVARHPDRVSGLLLVAGTPGDPFGAMFGGLDALGLPAGLRRRLAAAAARPGPRHRSAAQRGAAPGAGEPAHGDRSAAQRRACARPAPSPTSSPPGRRFLSHDWGWYGRLALALADERPPDLARVRCPVTVLAGRYDVLADPEHVVRAVGPLPQARIRVLPTSHFLPLEAPDDLADELFWLIERADAVVAAAEWADLPVRPVPAPRAPSEGQLLVPVHGRSPDAHAVRPRLDVVRLTSRFVPAAPHAGGGGRPRSPSAGC